MSFVDHLEELRKRIILSAIGVAAGVIAASFFAQRLLDFIFTPINTFLPPNGRFVSIRPGEPFSIYLEVVIMAGTILAAPWVLYQVWLFIAPGLYQREKRLAIPFVLLTTLGCVGGALFSHFVAFRGLMLFFTGFTIETVVPTPSIESVFDLYVRLMVGLALVFQMPTNMIVWTNLRFVDWRGRRKTTTSDAYVPVASSRSWVRGLPHGSS